MMTYTEESLSIQNLQLNIYAFPPIFILSLKFGHVISINSDKFIQATVL